MKIRRIRRLSTTPCLTSHPDYAAAKAGDYAAAKRLVNDLIRPLRLPEAILCPVSKSFGNAIPKAMASYLAACNPQCSVDNKIRLINNKTGSSFAERFYYQPIFQGRVYQQNYILLDDVYTTGKTLMALKHFVESGGGNVVGILCIGSSKSTLFGLSQTTRKTLKARFPSIEQYFDLECLTQPEAGYMLRFRSLQSFHNQIAQRLGELV